MLLDNAREYWRMSQHYQALDADEREVFVEMVVRPAISRTTDPFKRRLLSRIALRQIQAA